MEWFPTVFDDIHKADLYIQSCLESVFLHWPESLKSVYYLWYRGQLYVCDEVYHEEQFLDHSLSYNACDFNHI